MYKNYFSFHPDVKSALFANNPVLALESTIIAHGMPYPQNIEFAQKAEAVTRKNGAIPATIAIINGVVHIGLNPDQLNLIASSKSRVEKIAVRDIAAALQAKSTGATTVSATMHLAHLVGIKVFATGGIGGVHRNTEETFDISQDLVELSRTPMIVVSAGAKAILDIPKTLEYLETLAVPIVGYQTDVFPVFYSQASGYKIENRADSPIAVANLFKTQCDLKLNSALLVANPVPKKDEIPQNIINKYINLVLVECNQHGITGKQITPFLLKRISELSDGESLKTNIVLALNNVKLGAQIAKQLSELNYKQTKTV